MSCPSSNQCAAPVPDVLLLSSPTPRAFGASERDATRVIGGRTGGKVETSELECMLSSGNRGGGG